MATANGLEQLGFLRHHRHRSGGPGQRALHGGTPERRRLGYDRLDIDWYDPTARAHGYNANAPLILDEYGRQLPDPERFPSAADGHGFAPLAEQIHAMGLNLAYI